MFSLFPRSESLCIRERYRERDERFAEMTIFAFASASQRKEMIFFSKKKKLLLRCPTASVCVVETTHSIAWELIQSMAVTLRTAFSWSNVKLQRRVENIRSGFFLFFFGVDRSGIFRLEQITLMRII